MRVLIATLAWGLICALVVAASLRLTTKEKKDS